MPTKGSADYLRVLEKLFGVFKKDVTTTLGKTVNFYEGICGGDTTASVTPEPSETPSSPVPVQAPTAACF